MTDQTLPSLPTEQHMVMAWRMFTDIQRQYIIARLTTRSDTDACKLIRLPPQAASKWPEKSLIDQYITFQRQDALKAAKTIIVESSREAAGVLVKELKGRRRLTAAKEILDRAGLPAVTRQEVSGIEGKPIEVKAEHLTDDDLANIILTGGRSEGVINPSSGETGD